MSMPRIPCFALLDKGFAVLASRYTPIRLSILSPLHHTILASQGGFAPLIMDLRRYPSTPRSPALVNDDSVHRLPLTGAFTFGRKIVHLWEKNAPSVRQFQADSHSKTAYSLTFTSYMIDNRTGVHFREKDRSPLGERSFTFGRKTLFQSILYQ